MAFVLISEDSQFCDREHVIVGLPGQEILSSGLMAGEISKDVGEIVVVLGRLVRSFLDKAVHELVDGIAGCGYWRFAGGCGTGELDQAIQRGGFGKVGEQHAEFGGEGIFFFCILKRTPIRWWPDQAAGSPTYCDPLQQTFNPRVVFGQILEHVVIMGQIDEDDGGILGDGLSTADEWVSCIEA